MEVAARLPEVVSEPVKAWPTEREAKALPPCPEPAEGGDAPASPRRGRSDGDGAGGAPVVTDPLRPKARPLTVSEPRVPWIGRLPARLPVMEAAPARVAQGGDRRGRRHIAADGQALKCPVYRKRAGEIAGDGDRAAAPGDGDGSAEILWRHTADTDRQRRRRPADVQGGRRKRRPR